MSLIKWRKREITIAICSMILVLLNTWIFHKVWMHFYSPLYYIQFYSIGKYAATIICGASHGEDTRHGDDGRR